MNKKKWFWPVALMALAALLILLTTTNLGFELSELLWHLTPDISVWYGKRQVFGQAGLSQRWVNVLGSIPAEESHETRMEYVLNGGAPVAVRVGPDDRRLVSAGEFNIEIDPALLREGNNLLSISAVNDEGLRAVSRVTLVYHRKKLSLPYTIDWRKVRNAQQVLQIVDGRWQWNAKGIRTVETGYDRMLVVGDEDWTDYQVTVPVTFNGIDSAAYDARYSGHHAGVSIDMRWQGHSDDPVQCAPPHCGWNPMGPLAKYFHRGNGDTYLGLKLAENEKGFPTLPYLLQEGHTYIFKASVQTTAQGSLYKMSVWEQGVDPEPTGWMFERLAPTDGSSPDRGAFALVAHFIDVTFGNIQVEPVQ